MKTFAVLLFCLSMGILRLDGCDVDNSHRATAETMPPPVPAPRCAADRFVKTEAYPYNLRNDIALDSCTGQICRTWDWSAKGGNNAWVSYQNAPLCKDLAAQTR
jgi:hypothetical protein